VAYLKTLLIIRTQPPLTARSSVEKFYQDYPDSPLVPQAQALAGTYQKQQNGQIAGALASTEKPVVSLFRPGEVDNRMRIFYREDESPAKALGPAAPVPAPTPAPAPSKVLPTGPPTTAPAPGPSGSAGPAPAAPAGVPAPGPAVPATTPAVNPATPAGSPSPAAPAGTAPAAPAPSAPATAYVTQLSGAHAVVLVFPKGSAAAADLATQLAAYNNRFFRANNLQVQPQPLDAQQELLVVRALPGAKVAQSYATKLRGPQSPLARLRGAGYQAVVISLENLTLLQSTGDLAGYQGFYQRVYK